MCTIENAMLKCRGYEGTINCSSQKDRWFFGEVKNECIVYHARTIEELKTTFEDIANILSDRNK